MIKYYRTMDHQIHDQLRALHMTASYSQYFSKPPVRTE